MNKIWREFQEFIVFFCDCIPNFINILVLMWLIGISAFIFENSKEIKAIPTNAASKFLSLTSEIKELKKEVSRLNSFLDSVSETSTSTNPNASKKMVVIKLGQTVTVYPDFADFLAKTKEKKKNR